MARRVAAGNAGDELLDAELPELDAAGQAAAAAPGRLARSWEALWPKLAAVAIFLGIWQAVVWSHWKPEYLLASPATVLRSLVDGVADGTLVEATGITLGRAALGYGVALLVGSVIGLAVVRWRRLRAAVGSLITGLQTMPSIAWFPLAILLFQLTEQAILFVIVLGAAPAIANGIIAGVDHVPPLLLRAGRVLGARGLLALRHVVLPAALPGFVAGCKQGWAFAWRSLMAGELLVIIASRPSIGVRLQFAREFSDVAGMMATMVVILLIGILVDAVVFARVERVIRAHRGLAS
jgi:NitT/TauT family transport system permease protein